MLTEMCFTDHKLQKFERIHDSLPIFRRWNQNTHGTILEHPVFVQMNHRFLTDDVVEIKEINLRKLWPRSWRNKWRVRV